MPHKHTRRGKDESTCVHPSPPFAPPAQTETLVMGSLLTCHCRYELPPNQIARPLPVVAPKFTRQTDTKGKGKGGKTNNNHAGNEQKTQGVKRKRGAADKNDAPRAFKRLMALAEGKRPKSGLDDGKPPPKKDKKNRKAGEENAPTANTKNEANKKEVPTIRPGERFSEFAARVDAALPVMGLVAKGAKGAKDPLGLKVHRTRKERKMHKLYDEWRREEAELQDKRREEAEEAEEKEMDNDGMGVKWRVDMEDERADGRKKKKKGSKGRSVWETDDKEDDPWAELKRKRGEAKIGLHDVVKAPPEFKAIPKEVFKVGGAAVKVGSVPKAAGSLKRREELHSVREEIVANYRKMMEGKRARLEGDVDVAGVTLPN